MLKLLQVSAIILLFMSLSGCGEKPPSTDTLEGLEKRLNSGDDSFHYAMLIQERYGERGIKVLLKALKHEKAIVRHSVLVVLGCTDNDDIVPQIIEMLDDKVNFVRKQAVMALGHKKHPAIQEKIIEVFHNDKDAPVRSAVISSLGYNNLYSWDPKVIRLVVETMHKDKDKTVRWEAYIVLWVMIKKQIVPKSYITEFIKALEDRENHKTIINTLKAFSGEDFGNDLAKWRAWWDENKTRILKEESVKNRLEKEKTGKESGKD